MPFLCSVVIHGMLAGGVISSLWLWGTPDYYKPSAYTVALVDAPLVLQKPAVAVVAPEASTPKQETPAVMPPPKPVVKPAPAAVEKPPVAVEMPAAAVEQTPEMALPVPSDKPAPPPKPRPVPRTTPPQTATVTEVRSHIARLRQQQVRQETEQERAETAQQRTVEQRIAALREHLHAGAGAGTPDGMATSIQRIRLQAYQERVREKIIAAWILPLPPEEAHGLQAIALLLVGREGSIDYLEIVQPSGHPLFDVSLKQAIQRAAPLPALPDDYTGERLEVEMRFSAGDS